jgi:hypothetical protein
MVRFLDDKMIDASVRFLNDLTGEEKGPTTIRTPL